MAEAVDFAVTDTGDVGRARRAVGALLDEVGCDEDLIDDARLAVSEVVTNALLHGSPPVSFSARLTDSVLRVEVVDRNTARGLPQPASGTAANGRGLAIVDSLTETWGIESRDDGKAFWLELPLDRRSWFAEPTVQLCGVPVSLYLEAQEQLDSAIHELQMLALEGDARFAALQEETVGPLRRSMDVFRQARKEGRAATEAARSAGMETVDLTWHLPDDAGPAAAVWADAVAEVMRVADSGALMTPPPSAEIRRLRTWLATEVSNQLLHRQAPRPFPGAPGA